MDNFCGSPYWNSTLTWKSNTPDFTPCFENTALAWAPCLFLWIFTPLELYYIRASRQRHIPWGWRSVSKLVVTSVIILLAGINLGQAVADDSSGVEVYGASYFTPSFQIVSFCLTIVLTNYNRVSGLRTSGLLSLFWFFSMVFGIPRFRTELMEELNERPEGERLQLSFFAYIIHLPLVVIMFVLNCIVDVEPSEYKNEKSAKPCPELSASFISRLFFVWFDSMAWKGFRSTLKEEDLFDLPGDESCDVAFPLFNKHWSRALEDAKKTGGKGNAKKEVSVFPALVKSFGTTFLFAAAMELVGDLFVFVNPQLLKLLLGYIQSNDPIWKGVMYALGFVVVSVTQNLLLAQYNYRMSRVGIRVHAALTSAIYRKALTISSTARKESTVGEIVNLMVVDAQVFLYLCAYVTLLWSAPLQIILALYFLYSTLGIAVLAGLASMMLLLPVNGIIALKLKKLQVDQFKNKDERVKLMNEILNGIKVLKLYAWEIPFGRKIKDIREGELKQLRTSAFLQAATSFAFSFAPCMVTLVTFATYVLIDPVNNVLTAQTAFVAISLFNIMQMPLSMLPMVITLVTQAVVSVRRIDKFMNSDDLSSSNVSHDPSEDASIVIEKGTFAWSTDLTSLLNDINLRVERGKLVAVVGSVGSGKSSLLSAVLGEMEKLSGRVNTKGSLAYVPQQAWIQNATVKDNIVFGKHLDSRLYAKVIHACALNADLDILMAGDQTEIGEKGINLSGGQKQRVSIARAVYNDADVYLFDDPLSAVDIHVGKHIFENVIGPQGLLRNKTRVLVTHGISYLKDADLVVVLKDGHVSEMGTYQELMEKKGAFAEFLLQHLQETYEEEPEDLTELQLELEKTVGAAELQRQLSHIVNRSVSHEGSSNAVSIRRKGSENGSVRRRASETSDSTNCGRDSKDILVEEESVETGSVSLKVYSTFLKSVGTVTSIGTVVLLVIYMVGKVVISVQAFLLLVVTFVVTSSLWMTRWTDDPDTNNVSSPHFTSKRNMYLGVSGAFGLSQALFCMAAAFTFFIGCVKASENLHQKMFHCILRCPMSFFDTTPTGRIINRFAKDVAVVDTVLPGLLHSALWMIIAALGIVIIISYSTPIFVAFVIPIGALYYAVQRFYVSTTRQLKRLEAVARSPIYTHFSETISGAASIRAFDESNRFISEVQRRVDAYQACYFPVAVANWWAAIRLDSIGTIVTFFSALLAVFGKGSLPAGIVGISVSCALQITQCLNYLVKLSAEVENNIVSVERMKQFGECPQESDWHESADDSVEESWPKEGKVEFRNYEIRYREGLDLVLKGIDFVVQGGEKVGIVGRTGAGKSSLTLGLFRIVEAAAGQILIDGLDISKLGLATLRSRLTIIPQDPVLYSGSLRVNIDPFGKFADVEIGRALESAHLKSLVKGFAAGLDHEITEGGENLSVGQRQLVCLARALLRKTKVLVFDEATAAVDLDTDELIQKTIRKVFKDCTILTIAHRLSTIIDSDKVLVLEQGRIKEYESPQVLLQRRNSLFYSLARDAGLV